VDPADLSELQKETRQNIILSNETFVKCGGASVQKKIVFVEGDKTSSALIIMGIFFIVVVIGLFYYLPQWSPGSAAQSSSTLVAKKCNLNQNQTNSTNSRTGIDSSRDLDCADGPLLRDRGGGSHGAAGDASAPPNFSRFSDLPPAMHRGNDNVQTKMHSDNSITFALGSGAAAEF